MQYEKSNQTKNRQTLSNQRRSSRLPDCLTKYAQRYHVPENCGGSFPMKGIQHSHNTKSSNGCSQRGTASTKTQKKRTTTAALVMVCAPVAVLRVLSCSRCPWRPQCLSPLGHRSLERALVCTPFQSVPLLPRPPKQNPHSGYRYWSTSMPRGDANSHK